MDQKTLKVTQGALMTAIFGALVFINRQTAGILDAFLVYVYPLPIAVYTARYGLKAGIPAAVAMALLSFFLGTPTYAFYSGTALLIGLGFGTCLYKKATAGQTIITVMLLSVLVNLADLLLMASISGISMQEEAVQMQAMLEETLSGMGQAVEPQVEEQLKSVFTLDYLKRIIVISTVFAGALQGFLIYELGLLIMRRLRIKVPKPKSVYEFRPPVWTAYVAVICFVIYTFGLRLVMDNDQLRNVMLTVGLVGYVYLVIFGVIGCSLLLRRLMPTRRFLPVVLSFLGMLVLPFVLMGIGFLYITGFGGYFPKPGTEGAPVEKKNVPAAVKQEPPRQVPNWVRELQEKKAILEGHDESKGQE